MVAVVGGLMVARSRTFYIDPRALFHFFSRERGVDRSVVPVRSINRIEGYQNFALAKPAAGIDDEITHRPVPVIKVKSLDLADITVGGTDRKIFELVRTSQHDFAPPGEINDSYTEEQSECHDGRREVKYFPPNCSSSVCR